MGIPRQSERAPEDISERTFAVGTALAAALSAVVAGAALTREPLWEDELVTLATVGRSFGGMLGKLPEEHHGLAFDLALWPIVHLGGTSSFWLRLPALIAVVAAVVLTALVGSRLAGRRVGLLAAGLLALHPLAIRYAQEARMYAFALLAGVLAVWLLLRALERPGVARWLLYGLAVVALGYAHDFALLSVIAHPLLVRTARPAAWRPFALSLAGAAVLLAPLVHIARSDFRGDRRDWIPEVGADRLRDVAFTVVGSQSALYVALLVLVAAGVMYVRARPPGRPAPGLVAFLAVWLLAPFVVLTVASLVKPLLVSRYLIPSLPALCIALAIAATLIGRRGAVVATLALALVFGLETARDARVIANPDWPGAAAHLDAVRQAGEPEIVVGWTEGTGNMLGYYQADLGRDRGRLPWMDDDDGSAAPLTAVSLADGEGALARAVDGGPAWFVLGIPDSPRRQDRFEAWIRTCGGRETTWSSPGIRVLRVEDCPGEAVRAGG